MCGIAGYLNFADAPNASVLRTMCDRIRHRGPDAYGSYVDRFVALGHRRLSIIDLSGGRQPMSNEDGSVQVIFNGEIYNYLALRDQLIRQGHSFQTRSDTEVLAHLWEEAGERMPEHLNGMFAFAIWDTRRRQLFLSRDRLGKKPVYYSSSVPGIDFCFASELKALLALPGFSPEVDAQSVMDFLALSYVPDPQTIFRQVCRLEPGCSLLVDESGLRIRRYWQMRFEPQVGRSADEALGELHSLATDAVQCRLMSDVPLGAFLSGGVDSGTVVGMMSRSGPVQTFSIGFTDKRFDELQYAATVAGRYRTIHREQVVTPAVHDVLESLVDQFDEPFGDASAIPMLYLSQMTRESVTVALSGDGADELFGGYRRYVHGAIESRIRARFPAWFRRTVFAAAGQIYPKFDYLPQMFRAKTVLTNLSQEIGDAYFRSMSILRDEELRSVLSPELLRASGGYCPRASYRARFEPFAHLPPLEQLQSVDFATYLPGDILVKADRATMAHSLESRSPWLDYRLAELAGRLPSELKVAGTTGKWIFKRMAEAYLPAEVIYRPKMGFSVPLGSWLKTSLRSVFQSVVLEGGLTHLLAGDGIEKMWGEHLSGRRDHSRSLWNLLIFSLWHVRHVQRLPDAVRMAAVVQ
jgi:asparagine synthase (glutamine-hydrolysing)